MFFQAELWEPECSLLTRCFTLPVMVGGAYGKRRVWKEYPGCTLDSTEEGLTLKSWKDSGGHSLQPEQEETTGCG